MLEIQKNIFKFLCSVNYVLFEDNIKFNYDIQLETYLTEQGIIFENIRNDKIIITFQNLKFDIFEKKEDYLKISILLRSNNTLIKEVNGLPLTIIEGGNYINFIAQAGNFFYKNAKSFVDFINFLKLNEKESEDAFHFIDYVNDVNRKIVLTSLTEKSRLIITYKNEIPDFDSQVDLDKGLFQFKICFANGNYILPKFLKSSLIKYASRYDNIERTKEIFKNLLSIVEDAKMNFEIYINNLSIDKIRKDYDEYKSKYFNEASDILNNVTQKIIGFPIVIAATLFAVEQVKGNVYFLWILALIILITTIYLILLLKMNFKDLNYIEYLSNKDYDSIKENQFFKKFPDQFQTFRKIKERISLRIKHLILICETYFWILSLSNITIICIILNYLALPHVGIAICIIVLLFLLIITRNNIVTEQENIVI